MPSGTNAWLTFLTFDLLIKIVILHALLAVSMTNILLVEVKFIEKLSGDCMGSQKVTRTQLRLDLKTFWPHWPLSVANHFPK